MIDILLILALLLIVGGAAGYVYRARKAGKKCIGCPHAKACGSYCHCKEN